MFSELIKELLQHKEIVYVATSDRGAKPNVAPKLLIKIDGQFIYLIDNVVGKTWENVRGNPQAAISFMDDENLLGYQMKGPVVLLTSGEEFVAVMAEFEKKQISLTVERVIKGIQRGKKHDNFSVIASEKAVILQVKVEEITEIGPSGKLRREKA